jgi:hypothetical protein
MSTFSKVHIQESTLAIEKRTLKKVFIEFRWVEIGLFFCFMFCFNAYFIFVHVLYMIYIMLYIIYIYEEYVITMNFEVLILFICSLNMYF